MPEAAPPFELIDIRGVSTPQCSVVAIDGAAGRTPTIFVHGIIDNVWRWITGPEAESQRLELTDPALAPVPFDPHRTQTIAHATTVSPRFEGTGLLRQFAEKGLPGAAFSYQDRKTPVAGMADAVEKLHRVARWTAERWKTPRLNLVGHSRPGFRVPKFGRCVGVGEKFKLRHPWPSNPFAHSASSAARRAL